MVRSGEASMTRFHERNPLIDRRQESHRWGRDTESGVKPSTREMLPPSEEIRNGRKSSTVHDENRAALRKFGGALHGVDASGIGNRIRRVKPEDSSRRQKQSRHFAPLHAYVGSSALSQP